MNIQDGQIVVNFQTCLEKVFFSKVGPTSVLLIDSWTGHCLGVVRQATPAGKNIIPIVKPKGTTGKVQPLDAYGFLIWKNDVRHFSDSVILLD